MPLYRLISAPKSLSSKVGSWLLQARNRFDLESVADMRIAHVGRAAVGRPAISGGRAHVKVNKPIFNCDTKSIADAIKIIGALERVNVAGADADDCEEQAVLITQSDGQSMVLQCRLKTRHPDRYRHLLITCGNFHAFGHFMFGGHEAFFDCYTGFFVRVLGKTKVPKLIPDFENDAYTHVLAHLVEVTVGTLTYFLHDVTDPPPELFVSDPVLYATMLKAAGGVVAFRYLQYVGIPVLHWLRAGRESNGSLARGCTSPPSACQAHLQR